MPKDKKPLVVKFRGQIAVNDDVPLTRVTDIVKAFQQEANLIGACEVKVNLPRGDYQV